MRLWSVFKKTFKEQIRSGWDLVIIIFLAPIFILLYWIFIGSASTATFSVLIVDPGLDQCSLGPCVNQVIRKIENVKYSTNSPVLRVQRVENETAGVTLLRNRQAVAMITFPSGFTDGLIQAKQGSLLTPLEIRFTGDLSHPYYPLVGAIVSSVLSQYTDEITGHTNPLLIVEKPLGFSAERSEFDLYVPGLLIASIVMILFSVSLNIAREVESGTARRLLLTRMNSFEYLGGISLVYMVISLLSVILSFSLAVALGFHFYGAPILVLMICLLTALGSIAFGIITACFSKTTASVAVIASIPLLLLLFFSGSIFPLPYPILFSMAGHDFTVGDLVPTTHGVNALNKVLGLGAGLEDIWIELSLLALLTTLLGFISVFLFKKMQLK